MIKYALSCDFIFLYSRSKFKAEEWNLTAQTIALWCRGDTTLSEDLRKSSPTFWSYSLPTCEVLPLHSSAQAVGDMHQRERKSASASRVSPRIMDCWAAAKCIVRLQKCVWACVYFWVIFCVCKCMHVWTCACVRNMRGRALHIINTKLANYKCVLLTSTLNWTEEFKNKGLLLFVLFHFHLLICWP